MQRMMVPPSRGCYGNRVSKPEPSAWKDPGPRAHLRAFPVKVGGGARGREWAVHPRTQDEALGGSELLASLQPAVPAGAWRTHLTLLVLFSPGDHSSAQLARGKVSSRFLELLGSPGTLPSSPVCPFSAFLKTHCKSVTCKDSLL